MAPFKHKFHGELVLFDDASSIFGYEGNENVSFLNMEKERLQGEFDDLAFNDRPSDVRFEISGNRLHVQITNSRTMNRLEIVQHLRLLTESLVRIWEWVLINYDRPDSSTLMQIKNVGYVES